MPYESPRNYSRDKLLTLTPQGVIERLHVPIVAQIEQGAAILKTSNELAKQPNPFAQKQSASPHELFIESEEEQEAYAALTQSCMQTIINPAAPEVSEVARQYAPLLRKINEERIAILESSSDSITKDFTEIGETLINIDSRIEQGQAVYSSLHALAKAQEDLSEIAQHLPKPEQLTPLKESFELEEHALQHDTISVGSRLHRDAAARLQKMPIELHTLNTNHVTKHLQHDMETIWTSGLADQEVQKTHRTIDELRNDNKAIQNAERKFEYYPQEGSQLYHAFKIILRHAIHETMNEQVQVLHEGKTINASLAAQSGDNQQEALTTENYLVQHATLVNNTARLHEFTFSREGKSKLHTLLEAPLATAIKREARALEQQGNASYANIVSDPTFRRDCAVAKDVLRGGGRLKHPEAAQLNKHLHGLRFNQDGTTLEPEESGFIIAILTDKLPTLLRTVQRIQEGAHRESSDLQIEKLRYELPEHFFALHSFQINAVVEKIQHILHHPYKRNHLQSIIKQTAIEKLENTLEALKNEKSQPYNSEM